MLKEKTRRSLRAVLASACALSLAASMAFPLAAIAQSGSTAEADQLVAVDTSAEASAEVETPVVSDSASQPTGEDATAPAPTTSEPAPDTSTGMDTATESTSGKADDTEAPDDTNADPDQSIRTSDEFDITLDAAADTASATEATENSTETDASSEGVDKVAVYMHIIYPAESGSKSDNHAVPVFFPKGMSFADARSQAVDEDVDCFFNLETDHDISIGDTHPLAPGFTFQGWVDSEAQPVAATDPINESCDLYIAWMKEGSNVSSSMQAMTPGIMGVRLSVEGVLAGYNVAPGERLTTTTTFESGGSDLTEKCWQEFGADAVAGLKDYNFRVCDIRLFAGDAQIHDGFGSLKINFLPSPLFITTSDKPINDLMVRIWHKHQDGTITYEDIPSAPGEIVSTTVTDLSILGIGVRPVGDTSTDGAKPPAGGDDDNQDGTKPPANGNGDNQDNTKPPAGDNGNGQGNNSSGNGTQGTNNSQNSGGKDLAKTGDNIRYALAGSTALLACALFTGGMALLFGNRSRSQTGRARGSA